jgi:hypothetical protein
MKNFKIKNIYIICALFSFIFLKVQCQFKPPDEDLKKLRMECDILKKDLNENDLKLQINYIFIYALIIVNILFAIVIISFSIFEIIKCNKRRVNETNKKKKQIVHKSFNSSKLSNSNFQNSSQFSISYAQNNSNFQISREHKESFHSSNISNDNENTNYKEEEKDYVDNDIKDSYIQKPNLKESNYSSDRMNSCCEAPLISNVDNEERKNSEMITNDGYGYEYKSNVVKD